ncbi:MAG: hypothetical protein KJ670_12640 [Alphaproteobacteria bacterium]|jgi:membrane associated rhomboid family serine protease|nr:hypothetical protein [Rhizobiaceae bacterium]MBC7148353.1 hypothetical protein [Rhizobium sp.]MBU3959901.1 hypothetical protein [Alphaproteobacteria bacterium]MBU4050787.1 hypothetical protein [Alphaproteobacteria bacterium]MBU4089556.1 hypothetical protein [Alphaproteobacteria bacterium]
MVWTVVRALIFGLVGLIGVPIVTTLLSLALFHLFDPRCGTPGDSGGCEMGAASLGIAAALPGFALGVALAVFQAWRRQRRGQDPGA